MMWKSVSMLYGINDMYEAGLQNNKLNILYLMNQNANVAIKTTSGMTKRTSMTNIIMQGSLFCTSTLDKLLRLQYDNTHILYKYRGSVSVPSLEMVDDIVDIKKFGTKSVLSNSVINLFIEHKKLTLGKAKCHKIHCGKKKVPSAKNGRCTTKKCITQMRKHILAIRSLIMANMQAQ